MDKKNIEKRSPLKRKPLRNAGQSLDEHISKIINDDAIGIMLVPLILIVIALLEWYRYFFPHKPNPWFFTIVAILGVIYAFIKIKPLVKQVRNMRQGRDGEKAVGQLLETLRSKQAFVFHDIQADGFNIDHVVVHETGIYVIETKTYSKPSKGQAIVTFDGESVFLNGTESKTNPITQVVSASRWLQREINASTGKYFDIKEVVLFPGWYVQPTAESKKSEVWVLEPKALPAFIKNSKVLHTLEDVNLVQYHLSRFIRANEQNSRVN